MDTEFPPSFDPAADLRPVLTAQRAAYAAAPVPTLAERRRDLDTLARFLRDHQADLVAAISADYGHRSAHETLITEFVPALSALKHARRHLRRWMRPQRRHLDRLAFGLARNEVLPQPLGVVGVIVPWNFPINLSFVPLAAIFAAGNRAMVKMSENSRHLARLLIDRMPAYFPPEKLQFFDETGGVGVAFSALPFDHLLFTGSTATGRAVMAAAAANLCPVTLELGGKAPACVLPDFDIAVAAQRILDVKCLNAGQICTTVDHVFVPRDRVAAFVAAAQAVVPQRHPDLHSPDYTAIIDTRSYTRLRQAMDEAQAAGAQLIPLMPGPAWDDAHHRIAPHLVLNAPPACALMQREIFGPLLPVIPYDDWRELPARIHAGPRPLAFYPFTHDGAALNTLLEQVMSGGVSVNDALMHVAQEDLPFGGVGDSGMGHYHGREGFLSFSKMRPIFHQARWPTTALIRPPYGRWTEAVLRFLMRP